MAKQVLKSNVSQRFSDKKTNSFSYGEKESAADFDKIKKSAAKIDSIDKANERHFLGNEPGTLYVTGDREKRSTAMDSLMSAASRRSKYESKKK